MLYPLTACDKNGVETISVTMAFVVDRSSTGPLDPFVVDQAARRMVDKWRILAGRLEWSAERDTWGLRIPNEDVLPASYATHSFTHSVSDYAYDLPLLTSSTASVLPRPPIALFRHSSTPRNAAEYAKRKAPLLAIHLTTLSKHPEIVLLGISVPHSLVDATGMGMVCQALDAELQGKEWSVPVLPAEGAPNPLDLAMDKAVEGLEGAAGGAMRDYAKATFWTTFVFLANLFWEYAWHGTETKNIYIGADVVKRIVDPAKREVREVSEEQEYVSTGDVLLAWLLKSVYTGDTSSNTLAASSVFSIRPLLPSLGPYPHNALLLSSIPYLPTSSLSTTPLSTLALLHRRELLNARVPSSVASLASYRKGNVLPKRARGMDYWVFSNQSVAGITKFRRAGTLAGVLVVQRPDHARPLGAVWRVEWGVYILG